MNHFNLPQGKEPYFTHYITFIVNRQQRVLPDNTLYEKHHILPKSMGGVENKLNIIILTLKEHYIAHHILWKCYGGGMTLAFWCLQHAGSYSKKDKRILSSKAYERLRTEFINRKIPEEVIEKIRKASTGRIKSQETKNKISKSNKGKRKGRVSSEITKNKQKLAQKGSNNGNAKKVYCVETKKIYGCAAEAGIDINTSKGNISSCCRGLSNTAKGYHWEFIDNPKYNEDQIVEIRKKYSVLGVPKKIITKIICLDTSIVYSSIRNAENTTGVDHSSISKCCRNIMSMAGGFHWQYYKENKD
jgi:NUMOD3 motif